MILVTGGSGSGKSAFAEQLAVERSGTGRRYYLATMQIYDEEGERKVKRHRAMRAEKGFLTIEQPEHIAKTLCILSAQDTVLIECISNLAANEMFGKTMQSFEQDMWSAQKTASKITAEIGKMDKAVQNLVVVTNNVFEDGIIYDDATMEYIKALGSINCSLSAIAEEVWETVAGIPVLIKRRTEAGKCL